MSAKPWLLLILTLPAQSATPRMRVWRAVKALGAAVLRDGVYLLPRSTATTDALRYQADEVTEAAGGRPAVACGLIGSPLPG